MGKSTFCRRRLLITSRVCSLLSALRPFTHARSLGKEASNLVRAFQVIDQQERGLKEPRSLAQLTHEVGSSLEVGLRWLRKLDFCKESAASAR